MEFKHVTLVHEPIVGDCQVSRHGHSASIPVLWIREYVKD
jgi:hypothetical protein